MMGRDGARIVVWEEWIWSRGKWLREDGVMVGFLRIWELTPLKVQKRSVEDRLPHPEREIALRCSSRDNREVSKFIACGEA